MYSGTEGAMIPLSSDKARLYFLFPLVRTSILHTTTGSFTRNTTVLNHYGSGGSQKEWGRVHPHWIDCFFVGMGAFGS